MMGLERWRTQSPAVETLTCGCKIIWHPGTHIPPGLLRCALHRSVSVLLAACRKLVEHTYFQPVNPSQWACRVCHGWQWRRKDIIHSDWCPVPDAEAAIAKAESEQTPKEGDDGKHI